MENKYYFFSSTGNDEMCNFYMMYWVDGDQLLDDSVCQSPGPPYYYFRRNRVCCLMKDFI
jgi:peptidylglycine monooxygenase